ncbi:DUF3566 domain-containing protein [Actinomadura chokoriensis]|uniref:DUF3566 domain-containing protein n=1 Tax=Actinomadura chokoriensis TaxID=454156 RepID=A0ABV4QXW8_9ACTN
MSTEPGKNEGGPSGEASPGTGGAGKKPGAKPGSAKPGSAKPGAAKPGSSKSGSKSGKTVAAASAKSGRDETTVDIDPDRSAADSDASETPSGSDTTRIDLAKIEDKPAKDADSPEIAPVKDPAESSSPSPPSPPSPSSSSSSSGSAGWAKPAEPPGSVSAGRTENAARPFKAAKASPGNSSPRPSGPSGPAGPAAPAGPGGPGRGFAGTVLKDRPSSAVAPTNSSKPSSGKPARKAQLQLARLEPWSVMKFSFVMSLVCFVVLLVAVIVLYVILSGLGVFDAIGDTVNSLTKNPGEATGSVDAGNWFSFVRVFGYTVLVGALNVLLITALSTVGSVIYNLAADLVGGVEVTLKEAE